MTATDTWLKLKNRIVLRILAFLERCSGIFDPGIVVRSFFRLRTDIRLLMPWTLANLAPVINLDLRGESLPGNGYVGAMLQTRYFILVVYRQVMRAGDDHMFSITSPCFPNRGLPLGATEAAVMELEGREARSMKRYDNLAEADSCLEMLSPLLQRYLSCENFPKTMVVIQRLLDETGQKYRATHQAQTSL